MLPPLAGSSLLDVVVGLVSMLSLVGLWCPLLVVVVVVVEASFPVVVVGAAAAGVGLSVEGGGDDMKCVSLLPSRCAVCMYIRINYE